MKIYNVVRKYSGTNVPQRRQHWVLAESLHKAIDLILKYEIPYNPTPKAGSIEGRSIVDIEAKAVKFKAAQRMVPYERLQGRTKKVWRQVDEVPHLVHFEAPLEEIYYHD